MAKEISRLEREIDTLRTRSHDVAKMVGHHEAAIMRLLEAPTTQDLQLILVEMKGDIKAILVRQENNTEWQKEHQESDNINFTTTVAKLDKLNGLSTKIGIVGVIAGAAFIKIYNYIIGS